MPEQLLAEEQKKDAPRPRSSDNETNFVKDLYFGSAEKTMRESYNDPESLFEPYNPDDLYQKMGDYSIYEEMEKDDQVHVCLQLKEDMIIGDGFSFETQDDGQEEIMWDLERAFIEDGDRSFDEILAEILTSNRFGFSLSEKIFKQRYDGTLTLKDVKTRHPNTWRIETTEQGSIKRFMQEAGRGQDIEVNPKSLMHFVNRSRFSNPYGRSDMREAYNAWFVKRHVTRFYSIFLEKAASPTPIGRYDAIKTEKNDVDDVFNALKKLQTKSAMVIPNSIELDWLNAGSSGEAFTKGLNMFNMFIGRAMLIPDLMGFQGGETGGGAYALGKEQIGVFARHIMRRRKALERLVNKHLVLPIVTWNWGTVPHYPKFKLNPISEENALEFAKTFLAAANGKLYKPTTEEINHFRETIGFPQSDDVEIYPSSGIAPTSNPPFQKEEESDENIDEEIDETEVEEKDSPEEEFEADEKKNFEGEIYKETSGDYHKKVDFKAIQTQMDANDSRILNASKPIIDEIFQDLMNQAERKKLVEGQKVEKIDEIKIKGSQLNKLKKVLSENLLSHYGESQQIARNEIYKSEFSLPLDKDKFFGLVDKELLQYIGKWAFDVTASARREITNAIKDGRPLSTAVDLFTTEGKKDTLVSLERYSRTQTTQIMNRARHDFFEETGVVSGYQYSAILDGRTSPICRGLHGKFFKKGQEVVPPLHFNCRSVLIPITQFEEFEPTETVGGKDINKFVDENIGKGFSRK